MADPTADESRSSPASSGRLEIDCLSKEDLIKQIKKQVLLLQKSKNKCDSLRKQCCDLENELKIERELKGNGCSDKQIENLTSELDQISQEKEELKKRLESVQKDCSNATSKYKEIAEQMECMKMKEDSMSCVTTSLQEELNAVTDQNKELRRQLKHQEEKMAEVSIVLANFEEFKKKMNDTKALRHKTDKERRAEPLAFDSRSPEGNLQEYCSVFEETLEKMSSLEEKNEEILQHIKELEEFLMNQMEEIKSYQTLKKDILLKLQTFNSFGIVNCSREDHEDGDYILSMLGSILENLHPNLEESVPLQESKECLITELESSIEKLQQSHCLLEAELENVTVERDKLLFQEERENGEEHIKSLLLDNEELQMKLEHAEFEVAELQSKLEDSEMCTKLTREHSCQTQLATEGFLKNMVVSSTQTLQLEELQEFSDLKLEIMSLKKERNLLGEELEGLRSSEASDNLGSDHPILASASNDGKQDLFLKILESENSVLQNEITEMKNKELKYQFWIKEMLSCSDKIFGLWEDDGESVLSEINNFKNYVENLQLENESRNSEDLKEQVRSSAIELEKSKGALTQLESEIRDHKKAFEILQTEKELLKEQAKHHFMLLSEFKQQVAELEKKLKNKMEECDSIETSLKESNQESERCFQDLQTASELKFELQQEMENLLIQLQLYKRDNDKMKLLNDEKKLKLDNKERNLSSLTEDKQCMTENLRQSANIENEIPSQKSNETKTEDELESKVQLQTLSPTELEERKSLELIIQNLKKETKLLQEEKTDAIRELHNIQIIHEQCLNRINCLENENKNLQLKLSEVETDANCNRENANIIIKKFEKQIIELNEQLSESDKQKNSLQFELQENIKKLEMINQEIEKLHKEKEGFEAKAFNLEADHATQRDNSYSDVNEESKKNAALQLSSKEKEDRLQKYKAIAIKTKKEVADYKQQVVVLQLELDKLIKEKNQFQDEILCLKENIKKYEALYTEDEAVIHKMLQEKEHHISQLDEMSSEVKQTKETQKRLAIELIQERERHQATSQRLAESEKEMNQLMVMKLEMADCERLVTNLNHQLTESQSRVENLKTAEEENQKFIEELQSQLEQRERETQAAEERGSKLKALLEKTKKELNDLRKQEMEYQTAISQMNSELEIVKQENEIIKMESAQLMGETQKHQEVIRSMKESHQRAVGALESKATTLQEDLDRLSLSYKTCQAEYQSYKVRVHSVLKQQKNKTSSNNLSQEELEKERLEKIIDQLKLRLTELSDQLAAVNLEYEALLEEHESLLVRHGNLHQDLQRKEADWKEKYDQLAEDNISHRNECLDTIHHLQKQKETMSEAFKEQLQRHQEEFDKNLENIQKRLSNAEAEVLRFQKDQQKMCPSKEEDVFDAINTERQEGEGSESIEPIAGMSNKFSGGLSEVLPFEQLLNQDEKLSEAALSFQDGESLQAQLSIGTKKIEHLSEVLNESEASNMRLAEQVRVLKEEIRRLERNREREEHAANMEYLKNVILKFLALQGGGERERLVPVLAMMLRLSPQETNELTTIAKGIDVGPEQPTGGWGTYLPRWS